MPVAELFTKEERNEDVYDFIDKYVEPKDRIAIVTDTKSGYNTVMHKLKFNRHQYCVFHFKLNLNKLIKDEIKKIKQKITQELKKTYKNKTKNFIDEKVENELKPLKKEIKYVLQLIYYVFKEESWEKANSYIKLIKANMKNSPILLKNILKKHSFQSINPIYIT